MAETTPLLPRADGPPDDLPNFLCVCHSPWLFLSQQALLAVRVIVASFLSIVFTLHIVYGIIYAQRGKQFAFEASNVSLLIQMLYYWTTMSWTLQHVLAPNGRLPPEEQAKGKFLAQIEAGLSVPMSTNTNSKSCFLFSTFYTASVTFPFVVSIAYWLVLYPSEPVREQGSTGEALHHFVFISITVLNSVIAFVEILVLSGVRKQKDIATQVTGLIAIYLLYGTWTVFGHFMTGEYVYKYFDPDYAGWRGVFTTDIVILSLTVTVLFIQRGLHALRDVLAWKAECH